MEKVFSFKGISICYSITGSGSTVIFLHGFGEDKSIFDNQIVYLKDHCCTIAIDLPGSGCSELFKDETPSIEDFADAVYALITAEKIEDCILLGHSMGGYITLAFADKYPQVLKAFGLIHSTAFADNEEKKQSRLKGIEAIKQYGAYPFIKNTLPNLFSTDFKKEHPTEIATLIDKVKQFTTEALVQYYQAMRNRSDRTAVLKNSKVPVLFIVGTEDVAAPLNDLLQQVHLPNIAHFHLLQGVGHMGMLEAPQQVNEHLLSFLSMIE